MSQLYHSLASAQCTQPPYSTDTSLAMIRDTLVTIVRKWKQPQLENILFVNRWVDEENVVDIYHEILLTYKESEIMKFSGKWMDLGYAKLSDIGQIQMDKSHIFSLICNSYLQILSCECTTRNNHRNQKEGTLRVSGR